MKLIEQYFINRIDRALDQAQPLDSWTAWYVRRSPKLWEYYTAMIQLELELRFPPAEFADEDSIPSSIPLNVPSVRSSVRSHSLFKNRVWISTAVILLALFTVLAVLTFPRFSGTETMLTQNSEGLKQNQKIDLAEVFDELFFAATPLTELFPSLENPFEVPSENSLLEFPVEPIVRFTDCPLESTLTFLETAGIVRSSNHERD
ncbi:MAG: hypothetical protein LBK82_03370 [Planctomycetaceae bacterium]|jgi:hypothetical protein|nr:hypothetical protein [Planctomycetaceae bacterium]